MTATHCHSKENHEAVTRRMIVAQNNVCTLCYSSKCYEMHQLPIMPQLKVSFVLCLHKLTFIFRNPRFLYQLSAFQACRIHVSMLQYVKEQSSALQDPDSLCRNARVAGVPGHIFIHGRKKQRLFGIRSQVSGWSLSVFTSCQTFIGSWLHPPHTH